MTLDQSLSLSGSVHPGGPDLVSRFVYLWSSWSWIQVSQISPWPNSPWPAIIPSRSDRKTGGQILYPQRPASTVHSSWLEYQTICYSQHCLREKKQVVNKYFNQYYEILYFPFLWLFSVNFNIYFGYGSSFRHSREFIPWVISEIQPLFFYFLCTWLKNHQGFGTIFFFWHMDPTSGVTRGFIPWVRSEIKPLFILLFLSLPGSKVTKGFSLYFGIFPFVPGSKTTNSNSLISSSPKMFFFFKRKLDSLFVRFYFFF